MPKISIDNPAFAEPACNSFPEDPTVEFDPVAGPQPIEPEDRDPAGPYLIPESNLQPLVDQLAKLAKRAGRLGLDDPPCLTVLGHEDRPIEGDTRELIDGVWAYPIIGYRRFIQVRLDGQAPVLPGWKLVAVVEHTTDSDIGNVLRNVPGVECPKHYRQAAAHCDHCGTVRRRLETFVIQNEAGEYKQIGRNCLADFCRSPEAAAGMCRWAEYLASAAGLCSGAEDADFFGGGCRGVSRVGTEAVLALTARVIRHQGWMSRTKAREWEKQATADVVTGVFFDPKFFQIRDTDSREHKALQVACKDVQDEDKERAAAALEWIRGQRDQAEGLGDYLYNLLVVASEETVIRKHFGLLCSLIAAYDRATTERQERERRVPSEHIGTVGKRGTWEATVKSVREFESDWGVRYLCTFHVGHDVVIWWSSSAAAADIEVGSTVKLTGTVKKHGSYKDLKQTELQRCKVVEIAPAPAAEPAAEAVAEPAA